jgi:hypothetical protein
MRNKICLLDIFLCLSVFLFSFIHPDQSNKRVFKFNGPLFHQLKADTGGRAVNLDSAQACIDRFAGLMKQHGFADKAGQSIDIHLTKTSQMTSGESFSGKRLQDWLNATATAYTAAGKTLMINVQLGVYDKNYLKTYEPDASKGVASDNRIAIFLIPYDSAGGQTVHPLVAQPQGSGAPTGGGTGYDFGDLQP